MPVLACLHDDVVKRSDGEAVPPDRPGKIAVLWRIPTFDGRRALDLAAWCSAGCAYGALSRP